LLSRCIQRTANFPAGASFARKIEIRRHKLANFFLNPRKDGGGTQVSTVNITMSNGCAIDPNS
jgi:hypothetical protein